jgi:YesN/AraC family two-component response regulator
MFSDADVRELFESFPPNPGHHGMPPALLPALSGRGLITLDQVRADYAQRVTTGKRRYENRENIANIPSATKRISLLDLARDLDVSPEIVLRLIPKELKLALLSKDGSEVIPKSEHDVILEKAQQLLQHGLFSRHDFESENDVDFTTLRPILRWLDHALVFHDDLVCTPAYEKEISLKAVDCIDRVMNNIM